jgi:hypothetical protein
LTKLKLFDPEAKKRKSRRCLQTRAHLIDVLAHAFQAYAKETRTSWERVITIARRMTLGSSCILTVHHPLEAGGTEPRGVEVFPAGDADTTR